MPACLSVLDAGRVVNRDGFDILTHFDCYVLLSFSLAGLCKSSLVKSRVHHCSILAPMHDAVRKYKNVERLHTRHTSTSPLHSLPH